MNKEAIIAEIESLKKQLSKLLPMTEENSEKLNKKFRLEFHYNTNHIEGNTLTYAETELLLIFDETKGNHTYREHEEMKGSDVAFELIKELANEKERPLTEAFIKNINQALLVRPYWKDAITQDGQITKRKITVGDYKNHPNSVRLENGEIFEYSTPVETPQLMDELLQWYREEFVKGTLHPLELAARLHHRFVLIHPFDDGNGRISRLLMNYVLFLFDFPPIIIKSTDKTGYLRALRYADTGDMESFIIYLGEQLVWSLNIALKAANNESINELDDWKKNLKLLKHELEGKDEIKEKKSDEIILALVNDQILPMARKMNEELQLFSDLFLDKLFFYGASNGTYYDLNSNLNLEKAKYFTYSFDIFIRFNEFRKKVDNPFNISLTITYNFDDYTYSLSVLEKQIFANLYHKPISENQIQQAISMAASSLLSQIETHLQ